MKSPSNNPPSATPTRTLATCACASACTICSTDAVAVLVGEKGRRVPGCVVLCSLAAPGVSSFLHVTRRDSCKRLALPRNTTKQRTPKINPNRSSIDKTHRPDTGHHRIRKSRLIVQSRNTKFAVHAVSVLNHHNRGDSACVATARMICTPGNITCACTTTSAGVHVRGDRMIDAAAGPVHVHGGWNTAAALVHRGPSQLQVTATRSAQRSSPCVHAKIVRNKHTDAMKNMK